VADLVQPMHDGRRWTDQRCISSSSTSRSLLGLIHATVPFAPPLSSFECADNDASWTTASLSEFPILPSD
jgi:hypothetical protein